MLVLRTLAARGEKPFSRADVQDEVSAIAWRLDSRPSGKFVAVTHTAGCRSRFRLPISMGGV
jgi:hypothetical protein